MKVGVKDVLHFVLHGPWESFGYLNTHAAWLFAAFVCLPGLYKSTNEGQNFITSTDSYTSRDHHTSSECDKLVAMELKDYTQDLDWIPTE